MLLDWLTVTLKAGRGLLDVTPAMIESWAAGERRRGLSKRSANAKLTPVIGFYRWAHANGHTDRDLGATVRRPSRPRRSNLTWLSREQLVSYLDAARATDPLAHSLACLFALNGLRLDETLAIRVEHIGENGGHPAIHLPRRKLEQQDRVGIPPRTHDAVRVLTNGRTSGLLHQVRGKKAAASQVYRLLDEVTAIAGIAVTVRPHMLRATFITLALEAGVPVPDVMYSAGHSSLSMVAYYDRGYRSAARNASLPLAQWLDV